MAVALGVAPSGCSNQGEGERCSILAANSGNDDCDPGLLCYTPEQLGNGALTDTCCPQVRELATVTVCKTTSNVGGVEAGLPGIPEAGGAPNGDASSTADGGSPGDAGDSGNGGGNGSEDAGDAR